MSGEYGIIINNDKQKPHIESTAAKGKSFLFDNINPQQLFDKYAATGIMEKTRTGKITNKEICFATENIGRDYRSGENTNVFKIHHSKNRTHISPIRRGKYD